MANVVPMGESHFSPQFCRDRQRNIWSSQDWPGSRWRSPSGECFKIIEIAKRFDIAQTRGHKSVPKSPVKISVIFRSISAEFRIEFRLGPIGVVLKYHELSNISSRFGMFCGVFQWFDRFLGKN
jgi:hypothetical protein